MSPPSGSHIPPLWDVTEPQAELPALYGNFLSATYITHGNVCSSMLLSQFVLPCSSAAVSIVCSLCLCLYSCPANRFISTIFLDSTQYLFFSLWLTSLCITGSWFIHLTGTDSRPFLFVAAWYSIVFMYYNFLTESSVNRYLGCFHVLAIVHNAAMSFVKNFFNVWKTVIPHV